MKLIIAPQILTEFPKLSLGILIVKGADNRKTHSVINQLLRGVCAEMRKNLKEGLPLEDPRLKTWHEAYAKFGIDPKKHSFSAETLAEKVLSGKDIKPINTLVDLYNYFSLKHFIPIGGYDLDEVCGNIQLTYAEGTEPFWGIGAVELENPIPGEIVYKDKAGIVCRAWNYKDCERTKFTKDARNVCLIMEDLGAFGPEKLYRLLHELAILINKYCGGSIEEILMGQSKTEIELGTLGKTGLSDAEYKPDPRKLSLRLLMAKQKAKSMPKKIEPQKQQETETTCEFSHLLPFKLHELIEEASVRAFPKLAAIPPFKIEQPKEESHGDYASNILLVAGKKLGKPPKDLYEDLLKNLERPQYIKKIDFAEPGFINFTLSASWLKTKLSEILQFKEKFGGSDQNKERTTIVEYSSPNIAKPLGIHHLLSTIIGQAILNIYNFLGFTHVAINHIGDWGTQFGKLLYAYKTWGEKEKIEQNPIEELLKLYVKFHDEAEQNPSLEDHAREEFKKLEEGDKENKRLWEWFVAVSLKDIEKTYAELGWIHFDHFQGESFYNDKMDAVLKEGKEKKIFIKGEGGAYIVKFENEKLPPYLVQKSDGTTLYSTRDLAAVKYRLQTWHPDKIIYVVDRAQELHFRQLFETVKLLGWLQAEEKPVEIVHVSFGRMNFTDEKMSTRKGNIIRLVEVLKEAEQRALRIAEEKSSELKEKEKLEAAHAIGVSAVKYNILSQNRLTDITFDWDKMLTLEGNSAPYLQYTAARARSILRKADEKNFKPGLENDYILTSPLEINVAKALSKFEEAVVEAAKEYKPNLLCNYLYDLAQKFNSFYNEIPVLQSETDIEREGRLALTAATLQILENGLKLLGIEIPERM